MYIGHTGLKLHTVLSTLTIRLEIVFSSLMNLIDGLNLLTTNMGLDHIIISKDLEAKNIKRIATGTNSDHDGISCLIKVS